MTGFVIQTDFDDAALTARFGRAARDAVQTLGDSIRRDCGIYVPYDTGELYRSALCGGVTEEEGGVHCDVLWTAPHAAAVYYGDARGVHYRTEHHAHARARWFEGAAAVCRGAWTAAVRADVGAPFGG